MTLTTAKRFTIAEYHRLAELGFFAASDRIELIRGEIVNMAAKGTAHEVCITRLVRSLSKIIGDLATLRCQSPLILLADSEPEPDFTIVQNRGDDYLNAHPQASDALLVIEISDSTLKHDQEIKLRLYAEAGITNYWIFNLADNHLEAYSHPLPELNGKFTYRLKEIFLSNQQIALPGFPELFLDLSQVFPQFDRSSV
jgi:Uma2 family endonuclease